MWPKAISLTHVAERDPPTAAGHIHLGQFPLTCSDVRCGQIDGAAGLFSGSGLTDVNRTLLFGRQVHSWWRTSELLAPSRRTAQEGVS